MSERWAEDIVRHLGVTDSEAVLSSVDTEVRYFRGRSADGGPVFVKAVPASSPVAQDLLTEVLVTSSLPSEVRSPRLVGFLDGGDSLAVVFQFVDGRTPMSLGVRPILLWHLTRSVSTVPC